MDSKFLFGNLWWIDAILGKTFFSQVALGFFGHFNVALVSMFCVAAIPKADS